MSAHDFLVTAAAALFVLGTCCGCMAGHCVSEARAYRSCFWPFVRDAVVNGLAGAAFIGVAIAVFCYA